MRRTYAAAAAVVAAAAATGGAVLATGGSASAERPAARGLEAPRLGTPTSTPTQPATTRLACSGLGTALAAPGPAAGTARAAATAYAGTVRSGGHVVDGAAYGMAGRLVLRHRGEGAVTVLAVSRHADGTWHAAPERSCRVA